MTTYFDANALVQQMTWSAVAIWLINKMKASQLPMFAWISNDSDRVNRIVGVIVAGVVALGIGWQYSYTPLDNGTLHLTVSGLSLASIINHVENWIFSFTVQQSGYTLSRLDRNLPPIQAKTGGTQ